MAEWQDKINLDIDSFDVASLACAARIREKYERYLADASSSLIAVIVADFADDLRKELFTYDHI